MKRRDFLASSATLTGATLLGQGVNQTGSNQPSSGLTAAERAAAAREAREQLTAAGRAAKRNRAEEKDKAPKEERGLEVIYHGLCLFVMPPPKSATKQVDVAFINTRLNKALHHLVHVHTPTLRVDKLDVHENSTAVPAASDDTFSYYTINGPVQMMGTTTAEVQDWGAEPTLKVKDVQVKDPNPKCPTGSDWNNMGWVLDFRELEPSARLPKPASGTWREAKELTGVLTMRDGFLETDECLQDGNFRYRYTVNGQQRMLKEHIRGFVRSTNFEFVQFKFGTRDAGTSLILKNRVETRPVVGVDVFHLPTPGMVVAENAPLTDYFAMYDALVEASTLKRIGSVERRSTLRAREEHSCTGEDTPNSSNCAPLRITEGG